MLIATVGINPASAAVVDPQTTTKVYASAPVITGQNSLSTLEDTPLAIRLEDLIVSDPGNIYPTGFTLTILSGTNYTFVDATITPALNFIGHGQQRNGGKQRIRSDCHCDPGQRCACG
jgi:hypothetical protein